MNFVYVYATNPLQTNPVEGFTRFPQTIQKCLAVKQQLEQDIANGDWQNWSSEPKRYFVQKCKQNNWPIDVALGTTIEEA